jgi:D-alanyl-D-alanine carboxypeptidase
VLGGKTNAGRDAAMRALLDQTFPQAVAAKSSAPPLVAAKQTAQPTVMALEAPAPAPPASKKQVYALADTGGSLEPASFGGKPSGLASLPAATSRTAVPTPPPAAAPAKASANGPERSSVGRSGKSAGPFHVQVGAFTSKEEAESRLGEVKERAATLLDSHPQLTIAFQKDDTQWYRARFADFSEGSARNACAELKRMSLDCVVMRAN